MQVGRFLKLIMSAAMFVAVLTSRIQGAETRAAVIDWISFTNSAAAQKQINFQHPETNLLAAAVFHATNHERKQNQLKPLQFHLGATGAATIQSRIMRERGSISHANPEHPKLKTLELRAAVSGLKYRFLAENVALVFGKVYESGKPFYSREENGRKIVSLTPNGPPIPAHTYASFADNLVRSWMNSPGHRANILRTEAEYLGVSSLPEKDTSGLVKFYCTQVFYTPLIPQKTP